MWVINNKDYIIILSLIEETAAEKWLFFLEYFENKCSKPLCNYLSFLRTRAFKQTGEAVYDVYFIIKNAIRIEKLINSSKIALHQDKISSETHSE